MTTPSNEPKNPKDVIGSTKIPLHLVSPAFKAFTAIGLLNGALKYGRANYRETEVRFSIYYDALNRHMDDLLDGEWLDPDDMVPHLCAAAACLNIIIDAWVQGTLTDDRNYTGHDQAIGMRRAITMLTPFVEQLKKHHAGKAPHHWTAADIETDGETVADESAVSKTASPDTGLTGEDHHASPAGGLPWFQAKGQTMMLQIAIGQTVEALRNRNYPATAKVVMNAFGIED